MVGKMNAFDFNKIGSNIIVPSGYLAATQEDGRNSSRKKEEVYLKESINCIIITNRTEL